MTTLRQQAPTHPDRVVALISTTLVVLAVSAAGVGFVLAGGGYIEPLPGIPDPGAIVVWGAPITRVLTVTLGVGTIGFLLSAVLLSPSSRDGVVSHPGRLDIITAAWLAFSWAALALVQMVFVLANALGLPLDEAASAGVISTYAWELPTTRALVAMAVIVVIVGFGLLFTSMTGAGLGWLFLALVASVLPSLAGHGAGLGDHALALSAGVAHVAAAMIWVGGLLALAIHAFRRDMPMRRAVERFSTIALVAFTLLVFSGFGNAYTRLEHPGQLLTTGYGQVVLTKIVLLVGLAFIAGYVRRRVVIGLDNTQRIAAFARVAGIELALMTMAIGLGTALASTAYPRVETQFPTYGESLLGFTYPPEPTLGSFVTGFRLEPIFFVGSLVAAALYIWGYIRLRKRDDHWPVGRLLSWLGGLAIVLYTTNSGLAVYAQVSVSIHMVQHMTMTMVAPILLVLGAPATLALRAIPPAAPGERGPREWLTWFLHSWITRLLTNPFYVFFIYVLGLYGLYLTPAFGWLMGSHVGHVFMELHFILAGYVFYWVIIGIDPRPKPLPYWARMVLLLLALAVHGFFAIALMMGTQPLATEWYGVVQPPWMLDPMQDTLSGGQVAWGLSEIPTIAVMVVIAIQWARSDDREAARIDRQADRDDDAELRAYNERLAKLAQHDAQQR